MQKLYIGNKNYSSWSMRPWVLLKQAGIDFEEVKVRFDSFDAGSEFRTALANITPTSKVPVLVDGDLAVWDTLAAKGVAKKYGKALGNKPPRAGAPGGGDKEGEEEGGSSEEAEEWEEASSDEGM
jgi:glutathione S-transferase